MILSLIFSYFIGKYFYELALEYKRKGWPYGLLGVACFLGAQLVFIGVASYVVRQTRNSEVFEDMRYAKLYTILAGLVLTLLTFTLLQRHFKRNVKHDDTDILDGEFID